MTQYIITAPIRGNSFIWNHEATPSGIKAQYLYGCPKSTTDRDVGFRVYMTPDKDIENGQRQNNN